MNKWICAAALAVIVLPRLAHADVSEKLFRDLLDAGYDLRKSDDLQKLWQDFKKTSATPGGIADIAIHQQPSPKSGAAPGARGGGAKQADTPPNPCGGSQTFFVRNDKIDLSSYTGTSDAKGAAVSFTDDHIARTQTAEIHAVASYVISRPCVQPPNGDTRNAYISSYLFAPFVQANGTLSSNRASEKSALIVGFDAQAGIYGGQVFDYQTLTLSPFYQTDFRGLASAYGVSGMWDGYRLDWRLGGDAAPLSPLFDFYWRLPLEVKTMHVDRVGLTSLKAGTDYAWLGGTAQLYLFPFPEALNRNLVGIVDYARFWDAARQKDISLVTATLQYNLNASMSVSAVYKRGTDRDTLQDLNQWMLTLNYKQ